MVVNACCGAPVQLFFLIFLFDTTILSRLPRYEEARPGICSPAERRSPRAVARRCVSSERGGAPALTYRYRIDRPRSGAAGIGPSGRHSAVTLVNYNFNISIEKEMRLVEPYLSWSHSRDGPSNFRYFVAR